MAWALQGQLATPQALQEDQPCSTPALATHRGELWCLWTSPSGEIHYAIGSNSEFQPTLPFPDQGIPVLADVTGTLHAVITQKSGQIVHYVLDDYTQEWMKMSLLVRAKGRPTGAACAIVGVQGRLFLVWVKDGRLYYSIWTSGTPGRDISWTRPRKVCVIARVLGEPPSLLVLDGVLHVTCHSSETRGVLGFVYDPSNKTWSSSTDVTGRLPGSSVAATSFGGTTFSAHHVSSTCNRSSSISMSQYKDQTWDLPETIAKCTFKNPSQLAVLNGRLNYIFAAEDSLQWYSRPLRNYSLDSWMGALPDKTLLSDITIPGTHDTCARSNIPFVRTQYLSVTQQLEAGIRFLDLRCRLLADGDLYMYHGGVPMNFPRYLKLSTVMAEVFSFYQKGLKIPTETVLISINNDDYAKREDPSIFYNALKAHIKATPTYPDGTPRWITSRTTSTLGAARGKAVLLRRYHSDPSLTVSQRMGIDLSHWLNNSPDFTIRTPEGVILSLQDHWHYTEFLTLANLVESKFGYVSNMLEKAAAAPKEHWFINFMSAVGDPRQNGELAEALWIAAGTWSVSGKFVDGVNAKVRGEFRWTAGKKVRYGVVVMDFPELPEESDLLSWLVSTNFGD